MATTVELDEPWYQGNKRLLSFFVADMDADDGGATPLDLSGAVVKWALSRVSDDGYSKTNLVAKSSAGAGVAIAVNRLVSAVVAAGGAGYAVGDVLKVLGGTGIEASVRVSTVSAGAVTAVTVERAGLYSTSPSSPASTFGLGSGCTLTLTLAAAKGYCLVTVLGADTASLVGDFHQELEVFDGSGESEVVAVGDVPILRNVTNP